MCRYRIFTGAGRARRDRAGGVLRGAGTLFLPGHFWHRPIPAVPQPCLGRSSAVPRPFLSCASTVSQPCLGRASAVPRPCLGRFSAVPRLFLSRASAVSQPPCLGRSSACFGRSSAVLRPFLSRASAGAGRGEVLRRGRPALGRTAERARQGDADGTFSTAIQPPYSLLKITPRSAKEA